MSIKAENQSGTKDKIYMKQLHRYHKFQWIRHRYQYYWLPLLLGLVMTIAAVGLWQQLLIEEQLHVEQLVQYEADSIKSEFDQELQTRIATLTRMANRWQTSNGTPQAAWEADATALIGDFAAYQSIQWVDSSFRVRWVVPRDNNQSLQNLDLNQDAAQFSALTLAKTSRQPVLSSPMVLEQGVKGMLAVVPLFVQDRFDGFIVGVFQVPDLFDSFLHISEDYLVQIYDGRELIYGQPSPVRSPLHHAEVVSAYSVNWSLVVSPNLTLLEAHGSHLPTIVLWAGMISSWTLALTVYLGQRSKQYARRTRQINQQIQEEIIHRQQVETELREMTTVMENAVSGISKLDPQGCYVYVNKAYADVNGYSPEEMVGRPWQQTVHPDELDKMMAAYQQMLQYGTVEVETKGIRRDHSVFYKQLVMISAYDPSSQFSGHYCFMKDISERAQLEADRKRAEAALEKELLHSKTLFNTSIDGVVVVNRQGNVVQASPSFAQMLGYTLEETLQLNLTDWDAQWTKEELETIRENNVIPPLFETRHRRRDGSIYDVEISWNRVKLEGEILDFCICRDISDRKRAELERQQAETELRLSAEILRIFYESSPLMQGVVELSEDDIFHVSQNPATLEFFGTTAEALTGKWASELGVPQDYRQLWLTHYWQSQQQQHPVWFEYEDIRQGQIRWLSVMVSFIGIAESQRPQFSYSVRDISEKRRLEAECERSAAEHQRAEANQLRAEQVSRELKLLETILDFILAGYWDWDLANHQQYFSPGCKRIFGYAADELPNSPETWKHLIFPEDLAPAIHCFDRHLQSRGTIPYYNEARYRHRDGSTVWVLSSGQVIEWDAAGNPLRMIGCYMDISDRKHKEQALQKAMEAAEAANLAKSIFLANMSHELRTPLNVILGFTQVMAHDTSLTPNHQEDLQTIRRSGDHLLSLINDVLDLSKIEAGHFTLEESSFDLIALLHTLRTMMGERARSKRLQLEFYIAPEVPQFVIGDEQKLRQILLNLLSNAIKFTNQGNVTLQVKVIDQENRTAGEFPYTPLPVSPSALSPSAPLAILPSTHHPITLQFEVADTGIGIDENEQSMIFDAFVQAEAGKKSISGTGLGLTISRKLLELMQGGISVQSTPKVGSTFTFTVPICPTSSVHSPLQKSNRSVVGLLPDQPHHRILVVDDQRENRLVLSRLLSQLGLEVREATNGQDAIQIWQDWQPNLIWMDIRMPEMDGYAATRRIRALEQRQRREDAGKTWKDSSSSASIIIALTAQASQSDRTLALAAGCNDYISKPFREETLFLKLGEYLGLEYLYAEQNGASESQAVPFPPLEEPTRVDPSLLASLPSPWLKALEEAAICGNDRAVSGLATQLPPHLEPLGTALTELAEKYQFEQILHLIYGNSSL